ncbi:putative F-box/LRR-repeat protein At5g02930 isoform X2 [Panicum virgatum]|uniref:putative F-box/LRR-repeat protein At5g02930 isoform X2 n=1 Tax=Panicum virgatum TaxID=38727 RepID=UPI0019D69AB1|nr:putative F-box/LRR-repeat protein At5g02930 isoform X2 [Panicum virgatum]
MSGRRSKKASSADGGDRISGLPDEVFHRVLSHLPAPEAARTSVLARRWRDLWKSNSRLSVAFPWTSMTVSRTERLARLISQHGLGRSRSHSLRRLRLSIARLLSVTGDRTALAVDRLNRMVNRLLLLRDPVPLDVCSFSFDSFPRVDGAEVDVWICHVLSWQVPVLIARLGTNVHTQLGNHSLASAHLKRLELSEVKLKGSFLDFSSCTALVYLRMHACIIGVEKIISESLICLKITHCNFDFGAVTIISVPSLLFLVLAYCEGQTPMLEVMPRLINASIKLGWFDEDRCGKDTNEDHCGEGTDEVHYGEGTNEDYHKLCRNCCGVCANCCGNDSNRDCVLLGGLSSVKCLRLDPSYQMFTIKRDLQCCPKFFNLRTLVLDNWRLNIGLEALLCFLQHTPLLEKLIILGFACSGT